MALIMIMMRLSKSNRCKNKIRGTPGGAPRKTEEDADLKKLIILVTLAAALSVLGSCAREPADIPVEISEHDGSRFLLATNHAVDFHFYYPEYFILDINAAMISLFVSNPEFTNNELDTGRVSSFPVNPNLQVTVFSREGDIADVQQWWDEYVLPSLSTVFDISDVSAEDIEIAGFTGRKFTYTAALGGQEYRQAQVIFFRNNEVYTLIYTATPNRFEAHSNVLDTAVRTFAFN